MHDRDDEDFAVTKNPVDDLKTITFLLKGLYGRLAQEQEAISLASGQMTHSAEQIKTHLTQFEAFEKACRQYIVDTVKKELRQSITVVADEISQHVAEKVTTPVHQSLSKFQQLSERIEGQFRSQNGEIKNTKLWFAAGLLCTSIFCGLIGGLVVHHYIPETDVAARRQMTAGWLLTQAWSQLSKEEKEKIVKSGNLLH